MLFMIFTDPRPEATKVPNLRPDFQLMESYAKDFYKIAMGDK